MDHRSLGIQKTDEYRYLTNKHKYDTLYPSLENKTLPKHKKNKRKKWKTEMSEQISYEARGMYNEHKDLALKQMEEEYLMHGVARKLLEEKTNELQGHNSPYGSDKPYLEVDLANRQQRVEVAQGVVDMQAKASKLSVDQHLDEFVDQAVEDAAKDGVHINISQPQETAESIDVKVQTQ